MARPQLVGATAAAMLPAALSAAVLISAPFAGTTTAPLADSAKLPAQSTAQQHARPAAGASTTNLKFDFSVSKGSVATMAASEALLVGLGAGVIVWARRRRFAED
ncbi:MAG TPA: hypothetical protein VFJ17_08330 [Mycobacteriales bacterium]|jgi:hypothetical protein|nr:hypothetical protein [Mycobacteriales bacterium]